MGRVSQAPFLPQSRRPISGVRWHELIRFIHFLAAPVIQSLTHSLNHSITHFLVTHSPTDARHFFCALRGPELLQYLEFSRLCKFHPRYSGCTSLLEPILCETNSVPILPESVSALWIPYDETARISLESISQALTFLVPSLLIPPTALQVGVIFIWRFTPQTQQRMWRQTRKIARALRYSGAHLCKYTQICFSNSAITHAVSVDSEFYAAKIVR